MHHHTLDILVSGGWRNRLGHNKRRPQRACRHQRGNSAPRHRQFRTQAQTTSPHQTRRWHGRRRVTVFRTSPSAGMTRIRFPDADVVTHPLSAGSPGCADPLGTAPPVSQPLVRAPLGRATLYLARAAVNGR
jgi:hypothetical protein